MRPVASKFPVTLGYRQKMKSQPTYIHRGVDFGCPSGTVVVASKAGTVVHAGYGGMGKAFGIHVVVKVGSIYVIVAHLSREIVSVGQQVAMGQQLGFSGKTGNVTGPHCHYAEFTSYWYESDRTPQFIDDLPPAPPKPSDPWFTLVLWPLAGFDVDYGQAHFTKDETKIVAEIKALKGDVYGLTEVPEPRVEPMGKKLVKAGFQVAVSTDGRTILVRNGLKIGRTKKVTLKEKGPAKDDKQIVLAEVWPSESPNAVVVVVGHLEYRDGDKYDEVRVTQAKQEKAEGAAFAKACGVPASRTFYLDDENSGEWVLEKAYHPTFVDAFAQAEKTTSGTTATLAGWAGKTSTGIRTDKVKVHKDRPVVSAKVNTATAKKKLSNHLPTIVVVGKN